MNGYEESLKEIRRIAKLVESTEPRWAKHLVAIADALDSKDERIRELEETIYVLYGLVKVSGKRVVEILDDLKPLVLRVNERIRHDAVERIVGYLGGMGYIVTDEIKEELKRISTIFRGTAIDEKQ